MHIFQAKGMGVGVKAKQRYGKRDMGKKKKKNTHGVLVTERSERREWGKDKT